MINNVIGPLVKISMSHGAESVIHVDFSALRGLLGEIMIDLRVFFDHFRSTVPRAAFADYESNKYFTLKARIDTLYDNFDTKIKQLDITMMQLIKPRDVINSNPLGIVQNYQEDYGTTLSEMLFWDIAKPDSGVVTATSSLNDPGFNKFIRILPSEPGAGLMAPPGLQVINDARIPIINHRFAIYGGDYTHQSLIFNLNQLIYMYITQFMGSDHKIFKNLITSFTDGKLAYNVRDWTMTIPDIVPVNTTFGKRADPAKDSLLLTSIAMALRRIITTKRRPGDPPDFIISTMAELPIFTIENMRANLPIFRRLFSNIISTVKFLREFIQFSELSLARPEIHSTLGVGVPTNGTIFPVRQFNAYIGEQTFAGKFTTINHGDVTRNIMGILSGTLNIASGIIQDIDNTLESLGDTPKFLELRRGSLDEYKIQNNKDAFTPFSLMTAYLRGKTMVLPVAINSDRGRFAYGTGTFLNDNAHADGIIKSNMSGLNEKQVEDFYNRSLNSIRYLTCTRYIKPLINGAAYHIRNITYRTFATTPTETMSSIVSIVDDPFQDEHIRRMTSFMPHTNLRRELVTRHVELVLNVTEMNIMPINVHALMRSVAYGNVYNYAYSFEQFISALYNTTSSRINRVDLLPRIRVSTVDVFLKLLFAPYTEVPMQIYGDETEAAGISAPMQRIFRGDSSLLMGTPKFISDELFNKALFGSVYLEYDHAGVGVGTGIAIGRTATVQANFPPPIDQLGVIYRGILALEYSAKLQNHANPMMPILTNILRVVQTLDTLYNNRGFQQQYMQSPKARASDDNVYNIQLMLQEFINIQRAIAGGGLAVITGTVQAYLRINPQPAHQQPVPVIPAFTDIAKYAAWVRDNMSPTLSSTLLQLQSDLGYHINEIAQNLGIQNWGGPGSIAPAPTFTPVVPRAGDSTLASVVTYNDPSAATEIAPWDALQAIPVGSLKPLLVKIGKDRFDTVISRNLLFLANIQRVIRLKLNTELTRYNTLLLSGDKLTDRKLTKQ